jgi:ABC-2 type transport system permease protein
MSLFTLTLIIFFIQVIIAAISISAFAVSEVDWSVFTQMHLSGLIIILFFTAAGVLISMFVTPKKNFMGIVVGMTFGTYFLNAIGKSAEAVEWISYISPFRYLEITKDPTVEFNYLGALVLIAIAGAMLLFSDKVYSTKDISG